MNPSLTNPVLDAMTTALLVLDTDLRLVSINNAAESLLQQSKAHVVNQPLQEVVLLTDDIQKALMQCLAEQQPFTERDALIRLPDNVSEHVDFTVNLLEVETVPHLSDSQPDSGQGRQPALLVELQPLNRLQRINKDDESVSRQETARRLIRGLAHEIKNPLGGIRGAAQLLEQELDDPELKEYTGVIIGEADRLKELVDRLLGPQRQLDIKPVNILRVIERVISLLEAEYPGRVQWDRDYDPSLPDLEADQGQLIQAVMNITRNACEALLNSDDRRIEFRTRAVRQFTIGQVRHRVALKMDVTDNGPGIDPDLGERIFFPMISGRPEGTGLGLAITQNIVNQHRGTVLVTSRPGTTTFSIYLPFNYQPATSGAAETTAK